MIPSPAQHEVAVVADNFLGLEDATHDNPDETLRYTK